MTGVGLSPAQGQTLDRSSETATLLSSAFRQAVLRVEPSVVTITLGYANDPVGTVPTSVVGADGRPRVGAGVIIDSSGIVATSARLLQGVNSATVRTADGRTYNAVAGTVRSDAASDLAVFKISAPSTLPFARFGNSRTIQRGDWVLAVGGGTGDTVSFSAGVVGTFVARNPNLGGPYAIQHDADTDWSNAGGPLINVAGEVIGFNLAPTLSPAGSSASFAFPVAESVPILKSLIQGGGGTGGTGVSRAYLGLFVTELTAADAVRLGATGVQGALVESVVPAGPASVLGMQPGDILQSMDGRAILTPRDLQTELERRRPGDRVLIHLWRDGRRLGGETTLIDSANRPQ